MELVSCLNIRHVNSFTELENNIAEGMLFFNTVSIFVNIHLSPSSKSMYSCPAEVALLPPLPLTYLVQSVTICVIICTWAMF